ncbi:MAG: FAD-binding oxidoreductase [Acidobacteriia bacterium]|nr:FAD-binding oxidoreductase [Terriglobia bacterium]
MVAAAGLARELAAIAGEQHATEDPARTAAFAIDEVVPRAAVEPGSVEEVAAVLKYAHARKLVVVPAGGCTHQHTGGIPERIDILLRTERLKAVEHYDPGDLMIGVGAGTTLAEVERKIGPHQQMLPLETSQPEKSTIGGALATAAHGPLKHLYGGLRDFCTGVRFVTADGKIAKAGAKVVKNVAGYDLMKLLIGSYGTMAVITGASFKLFSRPSQTRTFLAVFPRLAEAMTFRDCVLRSPLTPVCLELVSPHAQQMPAETSHPVAPNSGAAREGQADETWRVLVRAAGSDRVLARYRAELGALAVTSEMDGEDEARMWRYVAEFPHMLFERSHNAMLLRVDVALQDVAPVLEAAERAALDNSFVCAATGRIGAGSLLLGFAPIAVDPPSAMQYVNAVSYLRGMAPHDGSAIVLRCPLEAKRHFSVWGSTPNDIGAMKALKRVFDGEDILNRGRFLF